MKIKLNTVNAQQGLSDSTFTLPVLTELIYSIVSNNAE